MSYQDFGDDTSNTRAGGSTVPAWASRANEPLVPSIDIAAIKKSVNADLKELRKAADLLAKLGAGAKKRPENGQTVGPQLLAISGAARERARATSRTLREALGIAQEGTSEHRALTALSDEFKQALIKFQQQVEATTHLVPPAAPQEDVETGGGTLACWDGGASASSSRGAGGSSDLQTMDDAAREQQMAQVATIEAFLPYLPTCSLTYSLTHSLDYLGGHQRSHLGRARAGHLPSEPVGAAGRGHLPGPVATRD